MILKNLEELKNKEKKSKKYKTHQKSLKARDNPKIVKEYPPLLLSDKTQNKELSNAIINDAKYVM